jgi:cell shape-determining protein MreD
MRISNYILVCLFIISLLLESTVIQLPLTLLLLIIVFVFRKSEDIFLLGFILGIFLDIFSFRQVGISSIFFISFLFLISLYDRKYEIRTLLFISIAAILGTSLYLWIDKAQHIVMLTSISACISIGYFFAASVVFSHAEKGRK